MAEKAVDFNAGDEEALLEVCKQYLRGKLHVLTMSLAKQVWLLKNLQEQLAAEELVPTNKKPTLTGSIERTEGDVEKATAKYNALALIEVAFTERKYEPLLKALEQYIGLSQKAPYDIVSEVKYPVMKMFEELLVVWLAQVEQQQ